MDIAAFESDHPDQHGIGGVQIEVFDRFRLIGPQMSGHDATLDSEVTRINPQPTRFVFPPPGSWIDDDLVGVGGDLEPGTLLAAYRLGLFPMPLEDAVLG